MKKYLTLKEAVTKELKDKNFKRFYEEEGRRLACLHYIEMNPIRAGIVNSPELYRWSSYRVRAFGEKSPIVDLDPWYNSLADSEIERQHRYREFFQNAIPESTCRLIREMTKKNGIVGRESFKELIEKLTHKEIIFRSPGRPKKVQK